MYSYQRNIKLGPMKALQIVSIGDNSEERVEQAKHGGKIILPNSALHRVFRQDRSLLIFKLINEEQKQHVFCGVFTFDGEENKVCVPLWMLKQLQIEPGDQVTVECVASTIQKGMFVKFEPLTPAFLQITDPKTVLEHCLRGYVCLSNQDVISIYYNRNVYELRVSETLPSDTIVINECDLTVDFEEMKNSQPAIELPPECDLDQIQSELVNQSTTDFQAFTGAGQSLGGKKVTAGQSDQNRPAANKDNDLTKEPEPIKPIGIPDFDYELGSIFFKRHKKDLITSEQNKEIEEKQRKDRKRQVSPRRPVTRSQTQPFRTQTSDSSASRQTQNGFGSEVGSGSANNTKRRKTNNSKNDVND